MNISIEKTASGVVQFLYGPDETPVSVPSPVNVLVKAVVVPVGRPVVKQPAIQFSFEGGKGSQTVLMSDFININGAPRPEDISEVVTLLSTEVFGG